jgi:peptide/nickel transport system substrate-binding protein/oligopeptide transport system substrate-binding protein
LRTVAIAAFVFCLLSAGCSRTPRDTGALYLALETSPNRLDPALAVDVAEGQICSLLYQGLVRFSPRGEIVADAAKSWVVEDGGRRYVFRMDTRARFSDGTAVTARDVMASLERVLAPKSLSPRKWVLERMRGADAFSSGRAADIAGLSAPDDSTVVIELEKPFRPFIELLAMPAAYVVKTAARRDRAAVSGDAAVPGGEAARDGPAVGSAGTPEERPLGSGRWVLSRWERGDYLELAPNPFHPGGRPPLDRLVFRVIPEAFTRIAEFESGTLDVLRIPHAELERFLDDEARRARIQSQPELRVTYIGLNNRKGPLADVRVRRALNMAVDVERIIAVMTSGRATRSAGAVPPGLAGHESRPAYPYDPAAAKALLREAGYAEGFDLEIWQRDSPEGNRVVEAVQGYLLEIGIRVRIVKREWSAFKEAVSRGRVDAFFLDWYGDYPDAENFLYPLFHSSNAGGGGNRSFFSDARVDSLIEESQSTLDDAACAELYAGVDRIVFERAPWLFLYFPTSFVIVSPDVQGYTFPVVYLGEDFSTVSKAPLTEDRHR